MINNFPKIFLGNQSLPKMKQIGIREVSSAEIRKLWFDYHTCLHQLGSNPRDADLILFTPRRWRRMDFGMAFKTFPANGFLLQKVLPRVRWSVWSRSMMTREPTQRHVAWLTSLPRTLPGFRDALLRSGYDDEFIMEDMNEIIKLSMTFGIHANAIKVADDFEPGRGSGRPNGSGTKRTVDLSRDQTQEHTPARWAFADRAFGFVPSNELPRGRRWTCSSRGSRNPDEIETKDELSRSRSNKKKKRLMRRMKRKRTTINNEIEAEKGSTWKRNPKSMRLTK